MKSKKCIAVMCGLSALLMIVSVGTFAGQWMVDKTFTDDFARADVTWSQDIGPGWMANHCLCGIYNRYGISGGKLKGCYDSGGFLVATNFMVGLNYSVAVDIQYYDLSVGNPWGDSCNELFGNRQYGPTPPNNQNSAFLLTDFVAPYNVGPPQRGRVLMRVFDPYTHLFDADGATGPTNFVADAWYHMTIERSNNYARTTVTGLNVNVDSGWIDMAAVAPPANTTNCYAGLALTTLNKGYMDNFALTTYKYVEKGTIVSLR